MKVTLIHNPIAGSGEPDRIDELLGEIRRAGHEMVHASAKGDGWKKLLDEPADLVAVLGGDGTVGKVARRLAGRDVPIAVLPAGIANNIARSLGLTSRPYRELVAGWTRARSVKLDVGVVRGPWQPRRFVEAVGVGLFAETMLQLDARDDAGLGHGRAAIEAALRALLDRLERFPPTEVKLVADGRDLSGEYVVVEAMNLRYVGPNLDLAPGADPGDGLLDLVLLSDDERRRFADSLSEWLAGKASWPVAEVHRVKQVELEWTGFPIHVDDQNRPNDDSKISLGSKHIVATIEGPALDVIVPG